MAIIHHTTMKPTKLELLTAWLPKQPWYVGEAGVRPELAKAGGFRLDDPEGEVGIEFMVVNDTAGASPVSYHVPMTYRSDPLPGAEDALVGTSEHGVLGLRRLYDATADPVFDAELRALFSGGTVPQMQSVNDTPDPTVTARLDGAAAEGTITVCRVLHPTPADAPARGDVTAGWKLPDGTELRGRFVVLG
ncbi:1,4-alpha-glucan branching protein [Streptomyces sp. A7024]|uniref:1,4-alpha-glucan branching protein n=1 Tax=Streptomyces coryli TaxID=1128680 RepID=A0A6G4TXR0_9ACTN|nr:1,4-alpha-glucan branching protein [Streptomyces coryli]NGN64552.1 1,4-alpha-glucan branching protein [Streptomyces coryli]